MRKGDACRKVAEMIEGVRAETHGDAVEQLAHAFALKLMVGHHMNPRLSPAEVEAIDMICVKLSRLAKGKPIEDHYLDIIGYAAIAAEALTGRIGSDDHD